MCNKHQAVVLLVVMVVLGHIAASSAPAAPPPPGDQTLMLQKQPRRLFETVPLRLDPATRSDRTIKRSRVVTVVEAELPGPDFQAGDKVSLDLFDNARYTGVVERTARRTSESYTLSGSLEGQQNTTFTMAVENGVVVADVNLHGRKAYQVRVLPDGGQVVREVDETRLLPCGTGPAHDGGQDRRNDAGGAESALRGGGPAIDVMVVYTTQARVAGGGADAMNALVNLFVTTTNTYYDNSLVNAELNLVYAGEVVYVESGSGTTDLTRLTNQSDGYLDEVHVLRNTYGADLVSLLVNSFDVCGIAWVSSTAGSAFSVSDFGCGAPTFAHEVGHNLGCAHDRANSSVPGRFSYSYGHRFNGLSGSLWRTVMSYSPGTRIPHFSNPNVLYDGVATGLPEGHPSSADNARTINNTYTTVMNFRPSSSLTDCNGNFIADSADIASGYSDDCNDNDVPDECDIDSGYSQDANGNGVPDDCECNPAACDDGVFCTIDACNPTTGGCVHTTAHLSFGDVTRDGFVDLNDLTCVLDGFADEGLCPGGDLHPCGGGDGDIDSDDIFAMIDAFGGLFACPSPCP